MPKKKKASTKKDRDPRVQGGVLFEKPKIGRPPAVWGKIKEYKKKKVDPRDYVHEGENTFYLGNRGKQDGMVPKFSQLKHKLLEGAFQIDLFGITKKYLPGGEEMQVRSVSDLDILRLAVAVLPKQIQAKVSSVNQTFVDINIKETKDTDLNTLLLERLSQVNNTKIIEHEEEAPCQ